MIRDKITCSGLSVAIWSHKSTSAILEESGGIFRRRVVPFERTSAFTSAGQVGVDSLLKNGWMSQPIFHFVLTSAGCGWISR